MIWQRIRDLAELVAFSHSIFALPFALGAAWVAADGWPGWRLFGLIVVAMVSARSCGMACNRWADRHIDAKNPRTQSRPSIDGRLSVGIVAAMTIASGLVFLISCALINPLALKLSPLALLAVCGYSFTKRFTNWPHLFIGIALGIAPLAAQVAVAGTITLPFVILGIAVALWVAGFDMLYALLDIEFDRSHGVHSLPARYGIRRTLWISRSTHACAAVGFFAFGYTAELTATYFFCAGAMAAALFFEQLLVRPTKLHRINRAFFTMNGWVSMLFLAGALFSTGGQ